MNDEELDKHVADIFRVTEVGSDALLARLQALHAARSAQPVKGKVRVTRVVIGLAVTMALAFGLLVSPRVNRPVVAATSVRRALAQINTWHLRGWKVQDGRRVSWEVWGRREPFFYREQVGDDIVLDDGKQRLSIYAPSSERLQMGGVCVRHPSLQEDENVPWSYSQMAAQWRDAGKPWKQTAQGPIFNFNAVNMDGFGVNTDNLYSIDGRTLLPTRYEKQIYNRGAETSRRTVALLDADYETPIPASASAAAAPPGYRVYDALAAPEGREGAATANGFTLQCKPLATDREGNILVQMRAWLGRTLVPSSQGDVHFQADQVVAGSPKAIETPVNYDDQGRAYIGVRWDSLFWGNPNTRTYLMLFAPREPLTAHAAPPTRLTVKFDASVDAGWGSLGNNLLRQVMSMSVSLPKAEQSIMTEIAPYAAPDGRPRTNNVINYGGYENFQTAIFLARARSYNADSRKPNTPEMRRHNYWAERAIAAASSLDVQFYREGLARTYQVLGKTTEARRLLLDMLHEKRFLKLQASPPDRSPAGMATAREQLRESNERYYREAREMLGALDKGNAGR